MKHQTSALACCLYIVPFDFTLYLACLVMNKQMKLTDKKAMKSVREK